MSLFELRQALYLDAGDAQDAVHAAFAPKAQVSLAYPFEDLEGGAAYWGRALAPLRRAMPDLERRDFICITGQDDHGATWVGCAGHYMGNFAAPFLEIPPTGRIVSMRYHEFFRIEDGLIAEMQALWDIPDLMMQAQVWPMAPSLGRDWHTPSPATQDGLGPHPVARSDAAKKHVIDMLTALQRHPAEGGPEVMEMPKYWHPKFNWYGPASQQGRGSDASRGTL